MATNKKEQKQHSEEELVQIRTVMLCFLSTLSFYNIASSTYILLVYCCCWSETHRVRIIRMCVFYSSFVKIVRRRRRRSTIVPSHSDVHGMKSN